MVDKSTIESARGRLAQVFRYLRELNLHRNPAKRMIQDQAWRLSLDDLPDHPSIQRVTVDITAEGDGDSLPYLLKVDRPKVTRPPTPPEILMDWLERGWDDPFGELRIRSSRNETNAQGDTVVVAFEDSSERIIALEEWEPERARWAENERPARQAMEVFEQLYELRGRIDREGEAVELMIGDGVLDWPRPDGRIHHPILLQRVELQFDPDGPCFTVVETERGPELYTALLHSLPDLESRAMQRWQAAMDHENYHPLGDATTSAFLRNIVVQLSPHGEFVEKGQIRGEPDRPRIGRAPVLFLRQRTQGFAAAIDAVLEDLRGREDLPSPLVRIVGIETDTPQREDGTDELAASATYHDEVEEILLSKSANPEQVRIIQQLDRSAGVLVQGPPGTGKSHTIANLIGHLLAHSKTVLVTAHTTKALRVLREYVVGTLQPLCVSVLDNDLEGRKQLEQSVEGIVERLSNADAGRLRAETAKLAQHRKVLIECIRATRQELLEVRQGEYHPIVVGQESFQPSDAARKVARERESHAWIPTPVTLGAQLPLSEVELTDLYRTNTTITKETEGELAFVLPEPTSLITPPAFAELTTEREVLSNEDREFGSEYWELPVTEETVEVLDQLMGRLRQAVSTIGKGEQWRLEVVAAGQRGGPHRVPWISLLTLIEDVGREAAEAQETLLRYGPSLSGEFALDEAERAAGEVLRHLKGGGSLGTLTLLVHASWKRLLAAARVGGKEPRLPEHFEALRILSQLQQRRQELVSRWERQMVPLGVASLGGPDGPPERVTTQWAGHIRECLGWQTEIWAPIETDLRAHGFRWDAFLAAQPVNNAPTGDLLRLRDAVTGPLLLVFAARIRSIRWCRIEETFGRLRATLAMYGADDTAAGVLRKLREAVNRFNPKAYEATFERLIELHATRSELERRRTLLERLSVGAPGWATAVQNRVGSHGAAAPPGDPKQAWLWQQLHDELERRAKRSLRDLERQLETLPAELRRTTTELIDRQAWAAQAARVSLRQRQALIGWADTVRRIGRGTGRRAPQLRAEAARLMSDCRSAVPVWIMPLARVVEQFDPRSAHFDVVIIDEASQSDVMALVACYLGKKVVVVGDHEQVSPLAVGQDLDVVQRLIATHLEDIPNSHLYDGRMSVYDLGRQSFGQTIVLVEHFRCVPEIIQFSNGLSYNWRIRPLRDASNVILKPHVVPFRVKTNRYNREVNYDEAWTIASLIATAVEQPEYTGKTFGVITLVGEAQALEIERLLRQRLPVVEFERRRIVCGNAAHFQGDERDVMFLSMVDVPQDGPLPLRQDDRFKQRYNVAASRARDQMWVVYSVDPRLDLKPGDLRRELIEHAEDPSVKLRAL